MKSKLQQTAKIAGLVVAAIALCYAEDAQANVVSDPVTASKLTVNPGANFISAPGHKTPLFTGSVTAVSGDVVTIGGTLTAGALNKVDLDGFGTFAHQYTLVIRHDRSADGAGTQGDWFTVESNTATTVTVTPDGFGATSTRIAAGDIVEIYKMTSLNDVFGAGATLKIAADVNFDGASGDSVNT
ncbi:MAG: hypothetical protein SFY81_13150, partial [Verrucomicrobiota bacterium]|nr:hypothetical protein [Verrucomicrobiota bacterium]